MPTDVIPFIIPLLFVTALYGSLCANSDASNILSTICSPPNDSLSNVAWASTILSVARFETIFNSASPPDIFSIFGAKDSATVLHALAPIASLQSMYISTINIFPRFVFNSFNCKSFAPPPIDDNVGVLSRANSNNSDLFFCIFSFAYSKSFTLIS